MSSKRKVWSAFVGLLFLSCLTQPLSPTAATVHKPILTLADGTHPPPTPPTPPLNVPEGGPAVIADGTHPPPPPAPPTPWLTTGSAVV